MSAPCYDGSLVVLFADDAHKRYVLEQHVLFPGFIIVAAGFVSIRARHYCATQVLLAFCYSIPFSVELPTVLVVFATMQVFAA